MLSRDNYDARSFLLFFFLTIYLPVHPSIHPSIPSSLFFRLTPPSPLAHAVRAYVRRSYANEPYVAVHRTADVQKSLIISCTDTREHFRDTRGFASRATTSDTIDNTSTLSLRSSVSVYICVIIRGVRKRRALVRYRSNIKSDVLSCDEISRISRSRKRERKKNGIKPLCELKTSNPKTIIDGTI